jgi:hypothetical protein
VRILPLGRAYNNKNGPTAAIDSSSEDAAKKIQDSTGEDSQSGGWRRGKLPMHHQLYLVISGIIGCTIVSSQGMNQRKGQTRSADCTVPYQGPTQITIHILQNLVITVLPSKEAPRYFHCGDDRHDALFSWAKSLLFVAQLLCGA